MKLMVIGLDCAAPQLVFEQWRDELPTLHRLMDHRRLWAPAEHPSTDYGARLGRHDEQPGSRGVGDLRVP